MIYIVAAFYKFVSLPDFAQKQHPLLSYCQAQGVKGTILLAAEGINGTIAASPQGINLVLAFLRADDRLADLEPKLSYTDAPPFERMKVRLKPEIVTIGVPEVDPSQQVGIYVSPKDWNALICDPEVTVIDTRNNYEVNIGTFKKAQNPQTNFFRQFPDYVNAHLDPSKHKKVALFCTGGIRCEKASAYMLAQGFPEVYHLQGGILKYLESVPVAESLWQGECFVFDERIAVIHNLAQGTYDLCLSCGSPISQEDKAALQYKEGISCPYCFDRLTEKKRVRQEAKQKQLKIKDVSAPESTHPQSVLS